MFLSAAVLAFAIWLAGLAGAESREQPPLNDAPGIVRAFLATFPDDLQSSARFSFDVPERRRWRRDPSHRPGIAWKDMTVAQRSLVEQLLKSEFSVIGFTTVKGIMMEQDLIKEEGLGSGYYWFAVYGQPGESRWGWRFGGHHVSLHFTYDAGRLISMSPTHLGGEVAGNPSDNWAGYKSLRPRETLARSLARACDSRQWELARISDRVPEGLELSEPTARPLPGPDSGLKLSLLTSDQRAILENLVREYYSAFRQPMIPKSMSELSENADSTRFSWAGSKDEGEPHYYRVQGPGFLIEYWNAGDHMHTLLRTDHDWGDQK